jgi:hypothetical protein
LAHDVVEKNWQGSVQVEEAGALAEECNRLFIMYKTRSLRLRTTRALAASKSPAERCIFWGMQMFAIFRNGMSICMALGCFLGAGC